MSDVGERLGTAFRDLLAHSEEHDGQMETGAPIDAVRDAAMALFDLYLDKDSPEDSRAAFTMGVLVGFKAGGRGDRVA